MPLRRYTSLKRIKPLQRKVCIVSSRSNLGVSSEETRKAIPKISKKRASNNKIYSLIRNIFLNLFCICEAKLPGCTTRATDIHHKRGRGIYLLIIRFFLPVCRSCHDQIGIKSKEAMEKGLSESRYRVRFSYLQNFDDRTVLVLLQNKHNLLIIN